MTEWYRNKDWSDEIETMFFDKLSRARSQRDQYIVLQAIHLADVHPEVTLRLIDLYFDTRTDDFHDGRARQAAAQARFALGGYAEALDEWQADLDDPDREERVIATSPLQFAFVAGRYRSDRHYDAAIAQLAEVTPPEASSFEPRFRYCAATAMLLTETGRDPATAARMADEAMALPQAVLDYFPDVVWRMRAILRR